MKGVDQNINLSPPQLSDVWDARNAGKVSEAYDAYLELCQHYSVSPGASAKEQYLQLLRTSAFHEDPIDFLLLEASFLRRKMRIELADQRIHEVKELTNEHLSSCHFQFNFQIGLNALFRGNYSKALDQFFSSRKYARNQKEFHLAFLDMLLCMDDLSFDYATQLKRFEETFLAVSHEFWAENVLGQYQTLKLRSAYRTGDIRVIRDVFNSPPHDEEGSYFALWLAALPAFDFDALDSSPHFHYLSEHLKGHLVPYRLRTLKMLLIDDDLDPDVKISVLIERFYLWVWRWLVTPDESRLDKVFQLKEAINLRIQVALTATDYGLLENGCRWLGLFLGLSDKYVRLSLSALSHPLGEPVPALDVERMILDLYYACREGRKSLADDTYAVLNEHPLVNANYCRWAPLLRFTYRQSAEEGEPIAYGELTSSLRVFSQFHCRPCGEGVVVDSLSGQVALIQNGIEKDSVRHPPMALLIQNIIEKCPLKVTEALKSCFSLVRYDEIIHDPKLANLLSRTNSLLRPFFRITRRGDFLFATFDADKIMIKSANVHTQMMRTRAEKYEQTLVAPVNSSAHEKKTDNLPKAKPTQTSVPHFDQVFERWVSRQELEGILGRSRTSTNRKLSDWLQQRLVSRKGVGKACRYKLSKKLGKEIRSDLERNYL